MSTSRPFALASLAAFFLLHAVAARAEVLRVPQGHATIDGAIAAAATGDTIRVAAGVYPSALIVRHSLVLEGGWDAASSSRGAPGNETVLDGTSTGRPVVTVQAEAGVEVVLDGFTIRNGWLVEGNGGGVLVMGGAHAILRNNVIRDNYARYHGGGVCFFDGSSGRLEGNTFLNNSTVFHGGALCLLSRVRVEAIGNLFARNRAIFDSGAGIAALKQCVLTAVGNRFEENFAMKRGAAVSMLDHVDGTVARNVIVSNDCGYMGGAIYSWKSVSHIEENTLVRNFGPSTGGIRVDDTGSATVRRNLLVRNAGPWLLDEGKSPLEIEGNVLHATGAAPGPLGAPAVRGARFEDPLLCDEETDQRLQPGSPLLGRGRTGCYEARCGEEPARGEPPLRREAP
ncbi:MAG: hypothetical protein EHM19_11115 [Candidatus Latescibacterota bacterium]|nr:MAG: hypothetical protein EHM19_11115 [Candidatus Latescibacterota bacterium]